MAGYIFLLDQSTDPQSVFDGGIYATRIPRPNGYWTPAREGAFADFVSMRPGDNVFFFQKRKIWGVGRLADINGQCVFLNYPDASSPTLPLPINQDAVLYSPGNPPDGTDFPWLCVFEGSPGLLPVPVDMDDALASRPYAFKSLRVMEGVSFTKLDDEEAQALREIISRRNKGKEPIRQVHAPNFHADITGRIGPDYALTAQPIVDAVVNDDGSLKHEMALEVALVEHLSRNGNEACPIFGAWNYVTHQYPASPFKPVQWMDRIDVFGYRREVHFGAITDYLVVELKRALAGRNEVAQLMKYVDWTARELAGGDYSAVHGFLVAYDFDELSGERMKPVIERGYTVGSNPVNSFTWSQLTLVRYRYSVEHGRVTYVKA